MIDFDYLADVFKKNNWTWNLKGRGHVVPDAEDIQTALDTAAIVLYDENPDHQPQLEIGHLIVKKTHTGHEVYLFTGTYV